MIAEEERGSSMWTPNLCISTSMIMKLEKDNFRDSSQSLIGRGISQLDPMATIAYGVGSAHNRPETTLHLSTPTQILDIIWKMEINEVHQSLPLEARPE